MSFAGQAERLVRKSDVLLTVLKWLRVRFVAMLYTLSPVLLARYRYRIDTGKKLNLETPQTFD